MKIAIDARYLEHKGGISRYIKEIVTYGSKQNKLICISSKPLNNLPRNVDNIVLIQKYHSIVWEQIQLPLILYKLKPDIYHAVGNYGIPLLCTIPSVVTVHDTIPLQLPDYFVQAKMPVISKLFYWLKMQSSFIISKKIVVTDLITIRELKYKYYINVKKVKVIPMGISNFHIPISSAYTNALLKKFHINKPYILNHGGLDRRKNLDNLMRAFAEIKKINKEKLKDILLVITGENILLTNQLKELAHQLEIENWIKFIGYIPDKDIIALVKNAKVVAYTSKTEGFGFPPLEAMACKVPVITSDIPIIRKNCKDVPIYINSNRTDSIFYGLKKSLYTSRPKKLLKRGEEIAREYSWEETMKQTFSIYNTLINNKV